MSDTPGAGSDVDDAAAGSGDASDAPDVSDRPPIEPTYSGHDDRPHLSQIQRQQTPYTESQVIMSTVKVVAPFALTFGLFVTFHGADSPGGGFQGGAIAAAVVLMIAFAFGIDATREWFTNVVVVGLAVGGVLVFGGIGLVGLVDGGTFLEYARLPIPHPVKYGMEGVEILGIAPIVAGVLVGLFFLLAAGFDDRDGAGTETEIADATTDDATTEDDR
ncbi:multicomponent Na+:H+ antiporter subunit B [Halopenitus malekzadehii]|uniref:Multicomponent Na+:H+ antiporter subunit B n=1 Tax=Halopenitus malekzadehii TaxID=1267564 RepID=A0A1H6J0B4_9EURY|nr:MnhB domain-containing protein [Halopenitus malekzadehii]SEH55237.1 multicomponent Na+:H+ antiporter subunit B [Halopenitus malekzadehii]